MRMVILLLLLCLPQVVFGADPWLVTCGYEGAPDCNFCMFVQMVEKIIDFLFIILTLIAVAVMMFAGFKLVLSQGNTEALSAAKGMLANVLVGFVMVMAAWLIVDTIMKMLIDTDIDNDGNTTEKTEFGMWNKIDNCTK